METSQLMDRLKKPHPSDFFILDIDSTLVTTYQRNQVILDQFIADKQNLYPQECLILAQAKCQLGDYGIETALKRIGFQSPSTEFSDTLMAYWRKRFFSNDFLHSDQPADGAVEWTQQLKKAGVPFIFLTARHHSKMWPGTLASLKALGFPIDENNLYLKEDLSMSDEQYKTQTISKLNHLTQNKTLWFIDNEPVVLHQIQSDHPNINLIWFDSCHSSRMEPPKDAPSIKNFLFL